MSQDPISRARAYAETDDYQVTRDLIRRLLEIIDKQHSVMVEMAERDIARPAFIEPPQVPEGHEIGGSPFLAVPRKKPATTPEEAVTDSMPIRHVRAPYGLCPHCGASGISRERRINGNDKCPNGHVYPSNNSVSELKR